MNQYETSGQMPRSDAPIDSKSDIRRLQDQISAQHDMIQKLQQEIRRIKTKLDRHADHLNKIARG